MTQRKSLAAQRPIRPPHDWRTTDQEEIERRRQRAQTEEFSVTNLDARFPVFSNFRVKSGSGLTYTIEIRDLAQRQFACDCVDFRINGLGTCKHVEAVLMHLQARHKRWFKAGDSLASDRVDILPDPDRNSLRIAPGFKTCPRELRKWFGPDGWLLGDSPETAVAALRELGRGKIPALRLSQEIDSWLEERRRSIQRVELRREYELKVQQGQWPPQETRVPLFPYQREGMLHLAFTERALLADEMGLGKTIQAIAACALLHRLGQVHRVLVVTPASLKTEWEEQIQRFTGFAYQLVFGQRHQRLKRYSTAPFFTIVNYEQMLSDALEVNQRLCPDAVVLDEAQRIKNWNTKTAQAVKRLRSRYAFVLTGTPIENRIDELHSLMDFLNPRVLGPLFRFNREFYDFDGRGRPEGYRNLDRLRERIRPWLLRRRKADVETELPERTDKTFFVQLSPGQQATHADHALVVSRLVHAAEHRSLTQQELDKLMRHLAMMRMVCDTNYILDSDDTVCPKLGELEKVLEECRENDAKVIIFSEWERMLELARSVCERMSLGFAWHTGGVPQRRRRAEINAFKSDPQCRVFLSTDSGSTGLNLQQASVVINCDLPWNPARLEQRIARAWRKNQTRPVTVINLVSENSIEHRMLETLALKQALADSVLDHKGDLKEIKLRGGRQTFLKRLQQLMEPKVPLSEKTETPRARKLPVDRALGFAQEARDRINGALVRCEERYPKDAPHSVLYVVVDHDAAQWRERLAALHQDYFGPGQSDPLCPVQLEVIDRSTDEALHRLMASGLITLNSRASRPLFPLDAPAQTPPTLSAEEQAKAGAYRAQAGRKLKMSRLLHQGDLDEESRASFREAALSLARALAVENRLPEPADLADAARPPLSLHWPELMPAISACVLGNPVDLSAALPLLDQRLSAGC